jgi:cytidine deaminase
MIDWEPIIDSAKTAMKNAYAPYSDFHVGAALLTSDGKIFNGCNVENSSYGLTICAERMAVGKAVSEGYKSFKAIVVISSSNPPATPCGTCRQFLAEFGPDLKIMCVNTDDVRNEYVLSELLPFGFKLD